MNSPFMDSQKFVFHVQTSIISEPCNKPAVQGGTLTPDTETVDSGSTYQVSCNSGFKISGSPTITCTNGQLSTSPSCRPCKSEFRFLFSVLCNTTCYTQHLNKHYIYIFTTFIHATFHTQNFIQNK